METEIRQFQAEWQGYRDEEMTRARKVAEDLGYALDENQVHISGERFLMSGKKLVLTGRRKSDGQKAIIKFSSDPQGVAEIEREHTAREVLHGLRFAYRTFFSPAELVFKSGADYALAVTAFIAEEMPFLKQPDKEQFFLALRAFETQEGLHVTTDEHLRAVRGTFGSMDAENYLQEFKGFRERAIAADPQNAELARVFDKSLEFLSGNKDLIEKYCGFFTHTDFVPHNLRISGHEIYLLDHSSIRFGNKYESWARFLNYMTIHNPTLERWLMRYVKNNRGEEYACLGLMRVFKIGFLLEFYARSAAKTSGDLSALSRERLRFWMRILGYVMDDEEVPDGVIEEYRENRDRLRSQEELQRQKELQQV